MDANSDPPHMRRTSVAVNLQIDWRELKPNIACSFYEPYAIAEYLFFYEAFLSFILVVAHWLCV